MHPKINNFFSKITNKRLKPETTIQTQVYVKKRACHNSNSSLREKRTCQNTKLFTNIYVIYIFDANAYTQIFVKINV